MLKIIYPNGQESFDSYLENEILNQISPRNYKHETPITLTVAQIQQIIEELAQLGASLNVVVLTQRQIFVHSAETVREYLTAKRLHTEALGNLQAIAEITKQLSDLVTQKYKIRMDR